MGTVLRLDEVVVVALTDAMVDEVDEVDDVEEVVAVVEVVSDEELTELLVLMTDETVELEEIELQIHRAHHGSGYPPGPSYGSGSGSNPTRQVLSIAKPGFSGYP